MTRVGFIGWRGMVGSVLMQRMHQESDFKNLDPVFFSTSQVGQYGPNINDQNSTLLDAYSIKDLSQLDIILSCQGGAYTENVYPKLQETGWDGHWIDAASTLRMSDDALIVLDPINRKSIDIAYEKGIKTWVGGNCTVSLMLLAIQGLIKENLIQWVSSMTYQAASGAGAQNMRELLIQMGELSNSVKSELLDSQSDILAVDKKILSTMHSPSFSQKNFTVPLAGNLITWIDQDLGDGKSKEEWKGQVESNKILKDTYSSIKVDGLCVRIGAMRSHSQALTIKLNKTTSIEKVNELISNGNEWVKFISNSKQSSIENLSPAAVSGKLDIAIGRIRELDLEENTISAFTVGDQLLWGAAEPLRRILKILINKAQSS